MFNTFSDVFNTDENNTKKMNGTNPFDLPSSTTDPFGISSSMKISESSEKFDDNPFILNKNNDKSVRPRSGKEALSSSNWLAYQHSMDEANLDSTEDLQDTSLITQSNKVNLNNPFSISTTSNTDQSKETISQNFPIDLLFETNININSGNPFSNLDQNPLPYDLFGLNQANASSTSSSKVVESDSKTDMSKINQNKTSSSSMTTKSSIPEVTSSHSTPINAAPLTSHSVHDNQFVDWFTQSDNLMSDVDSKLNEPSKKNDINTNKNTDDLFGSIYRQPQTLATLRMLYYKFFYCILVLLIKILILEENSQENVPSPPIIVSKTPIRHSSKEEVPSICIYEPTVEHNDSNIVPQGYFDNKKNNQSDDDSDDDTKMVFKIKEKKFNVSHDTNIPVPLLPPPPSSKSYKEASDDASSSSSETDNQDDDDPLAMFRSKSIKTKTNQHQGKNLITDWDEDETKINEQSVCLMFVYMYLLLSCMFYKFIQGWCCFHILKTFFFYFSFIKF